MTSWWCIKGCSTGPLLCASTCNRQIPLQKESNTQKCVHIMTLLCDSRINAWIYRLILQRSVPCTKSQLQIVIFAFYFQSFQLSIYTPRPDITPCFEYTLLTWIPLATILVMLPLALLYHRGVPSLRIKSRTCLFTTKQVNQITYS